MQGNLALDVQRSVLHNPRGSNQSVVEPLTRVWTLLGALVYTRAILFNSRCKVSHGISIALFLKKKIQEKPLSEHVSPT